MTDDEPALDWSETSPETAKVILAQADLLLQAQLQSAFASDQRASTMASILASVASAAVAGLIALAGKIDPSSITAGAVGALLLYVAAGFAAWAARPIDFFFPGSRPEQWYDVREEKNFALLLGGAAENCQYAIDENEAFMAGNQSAVRVAFVLSLLSPLATAVTIFLV